jgi:Flp pilus assembly pilin Flp
MEKSMVFCKKIKDSNAIFFATKSLKKLYFDESGAVAAEYVIITGLLAIALIGTANALAEATRLWFWRKALRIIKY